MVPMWLLCFLCAQSTYSPEHPYFVRNTNVIPQQDDVYTSLIASLCDQSETGKIPVDSIEGMLSVVIPSEKRTNTKMGLIKVFSNDTSEFNLNCEMKPCKYGDVATIALFMLIITDYETAEALANLLQSSKGDNDISFDGYSGTLRDYLTVLTNKYADISSFESWPTITQEAFVSFKNLPENQIKLDVKEYKLRLLKKFADSKYKILLHSPQPPSMQFVDGRTRVGCSRMILFGYDHKNDCLATVDDFGDDFYGVRNTRTSEVLGKTGSLQSKVISLSLLPFTADTAVLYTRSEQILQKSLVSSRNKKGAWFLISVLDSLEDDYVISDLDTSVSIRKVVASHFKKYVDKVRSVVCD